MIFIKDNLIDVVLIHVKDQAEHDTQLLATLSTWRKPGLPITLTSVPLARGLSYL